MSWIRQTTSRLNGDLSAVTLAAGCGESWLDKVGFDGIFHDHFVVFVSPTDKVDTASIYKPINQIVIEYHNAETAYCEYIEELGIVLPERHILCLPKESQYSAVNTKFKVGEKVFSGAVLPNWRLDSKSGNYLAYDKHRNWFIANYYSQTYESLGDCMDTAIAYATMTLWS